MTGPGEQSSFGVTSDGAPLVTAEVGSRVAHVFMNRPAARNALSVDLCNALTEAVKAAGASNEARVIVLSGEGSVFCAGADFAAVSGPGGLDFVPAFERMLETVARCRLPVIASIQGAALGGGLQLAVACDFRAVAAEAKLGIPSARLGILVNFENVQRLVLLVGPALAREILMTARTFTGQEAVESGLAHRAVPTAQLDAAVEEWAATIAEMAPLSVQGSKLSIQAVVDHLSSSRTTLPERAADVDRLVAEAYRSADLAEGLKAMSEKRKPNFKGH